MRHVYGQSKRKSVLLSSGRFRGKRFYAGWLAAAFAVCAAATHAAEIVWQPKNGSTDISDPENWAGGVLPGNGDIKKFGNGNLSGDYTVKIPAATAENPYRDKSGLLIDGVNDGQTVTIDATGTSWLQMGDEGQAWHSNVPMRARPWDHFFDIDNAYNTANPANHFGFSFTDGTISFKRDFTNGSVLTFNGDFNMAVAPDGKENAHKTVLFHDTNANSKNSKIIFHGGESTLRNVQFRGKTEGNEFRVEGGLLHILNGLAINEDSTGYKHDAFFHVTRDGQVSVDSGALWIGHNNDGRGVLRIDGNGKFTMTEGTIITYFPDGAEQTGLLSIGGNGEWNSVKNINVGNNGGTANILVEENGFFNHSGWFNFGSHDGARVTLSLKDNARGNIVNASIVKDVSDGKSRTGVIELSGDSVLDVKSNGDIANRDGSVFTLNMSDRARLRMSRTDQGQDWVIFGNNSASTVKLNLAGGTIEKFGGGKLVHFQLKGGPGSSYNLSGVTLDTQNFIIEGKSDTNAPDVWHTVRQTEGEISVRWHGTGDGLDIRGGNGRNAMYLLEGGTLNVGNMMRVGHSNTDSSKQWRSVFRQTGGQANISANVNLCDSATMGEFELLGGRTRLTCLRGWLQSVARNANGAWATALFDGGTIEPWSNNQDTIVTMPELRLGAKGLTFDTVGYSETRIAAKFQNEGMGTEHEVDGLFVKTGAGTLKAKMVETDTGAKGEYAGRVLKSTHTYTRIDQGTLQLTEAADAAFGKNITVKGGATLSLEGTASTLTVDTLTLGDGNGTATLVLDAGDKVYVENGGNVADPLSSAGGAVSASWATTNGSYPVFYVKGDVGARYLVDMLCDWVAIYGGSSSKDYIWSAAYDDVSGYTVASVEVGNQGEFSKILTFESAGGGVTVTTNGTGRVFSVVTATTTSSHGEDLPLAASTAVDVSTDATLTLGGDLTGRDVRLTKIGSGELDLTGDNTGFTGTIVVNGGRTVVEDKTALGGMNPVTLKSGTFKFAAGDTSGVEPLCLAIETSANKVMPIVEVAENATFTATEVSHTQGGLVKTGAGTLALDLPAGTHTVIKNNGNENNPDSSVSLPATGDSPADVSAFSALTVLEGALNVQGEGADKTFVKFSDPVLIGGQYAGSSPAVLTLNDVEMSTDGKHISFGRKVPNGGFASELHMTNAVFRTNKLEVGHDGATPSLEFLVDMKDSTLVDNYKIQFGWGNARVKIIADNSRIESTGNEGVVVGGFISAVFNGENAGLASTMQPATGKGGLVTVHNQSYGQGVPMRFENGARLAVSQGLYFQNDNVNNGYISVVFDDGVFEVLPSTAEQNFRSRMAQPQNQGFTVENGGLEIDIAENVNHYITFPIRGEGSVVKTGEGVLYLTESYNLNTPSTEKLLQYTGGTVVSNGTLVVDGSLVDGAKSFEVAKGATLDLNKTTLAGATIAGAGVVTNGTLSAATLAYDSDALPTFSGVAFKGALIVDFGRTEDNPLDIDEASAGISIARYTGEAPVNLRVKAINTGIQRARAAVDFVGGVIVMKVDQTGFLMIVR